VRRLLRVVRSKTVVKPEVLIVCLWLHWLPWQCQVTCISVSVRWPVFGAGLICTCRLAF